MFENLTNHLNKAFKLLKGQGKITEINVAATTKEIRRALIQADVNYKIAKQITDDIKNQSIGKEVLTSVSPGQVFTKIVSDELTRLMGSEQAGIHLTGNPAVILMTGLQGSGKTTFTAKLANYLKKKNKSVLLAACDVYRPAAAEQLKVLSEQIEIPIFADAGNTNVLQIAEAAIKEAKHLNKQVVIIDTAGRQTVDMKMMQELKALQIAVKPAETLLVVDAMTGQDAVTTAQAFHEQINIDGIILTKLDGDSHGGAAISIRAAVNKPIKFIGTGEKITDLDVFYPDRMAKRILGMGDVISLVERAEQVFDEQEARRLEQKIRKNQFDYNDFLKQVNQLKKMGNFNDLISMIPGFNKVKAKIGKIDNDVFKPFEIMISSMTPQERRHPELMNMSRKIRIAKGAGMTIEDINSLIKQFNNMSQFLRKLQKGGKEQLMHMANQLQ